MSDSDESSSDGDYYGPALPPNFKKPEISVEPPPRGAIIGPFIPEQFRKQQKEVELQSDDNSKTQTCTSGVSGPVISGSHDESKTVLVQIGPALPPGMRVNLEDATANKNLTSSDHREFEEDSDSSDSDIIGPLPPDHPKALARSSHGSNRSVKLDKPTKKLQREEWMLIPPRNKPVTELGLAPRKFLTRAPAEPVKEGEDVDSDEEFERNTRAAMDQQIIDAYDKTMEAMKDKVDGGKRSSLLEIHQQELKKRKEEAPEQKERRPFDRDVDLQVNGLSGDDRKKYIEKSRELNTRFSQGRQKFL